MKKTALPLAMVLLAAPALAVASPEVQVRQSPTPAPIVIHARPLLRERVLANRFRVVQSLPLRVTVETTTKPRVLVTFHTSIHTALALHPGELVRLKIVPARVRP